jgi:arginyl-tRNA synthetase
LNIRLSDERFTHELQSILAGQKTYGASVRYKDKVVIAEYSDPNPFKVLHAGHLYTSVVGDAIANLFEVAGATVHRVNFGGDVGLHVGKTMWAILGRLKGEHPDALADIPEAERSEWLAAAYIEGTNAYEDDEHAKAEIITLNKRVYQLHSDGDTTSPFARIYWTCRRWSYDYFDAFYARIGTTFEKYYPESETAPLGLQTVREHIGPVYQESNGAIIFDGDAHGLHTRVFINSEGLPTYEAKDVGLIMKKWADYHFDLSVVITGNDIIEYMKVVLKSIEQFQPELPARTRHLTHGIVKLEGGTKMSSRKGNILRAVDVLEAAAAANKAATGNEDEQVTLGAVKYAFLKPRMGGDIIYDPKESVSLQGNSGPYLQYAHARAVNILKKAANQPGEAYLGQPNSSERTLVRKLTEYPEAIDKALDDMLPHHVCTYLYELAQVFNRFYEQNRVIGDEHEADRLTLVSAYAAVLRNGLELLGIQAPESM